MPNDLSQYESRRNNEHTSLKDETVPFHREHPLPKVRKKTLEVN